VVSINENGGTAAVQGAWLKPGCLDDWWMLDVAVDGSEILHQLSRLFHYLQGVEYTSQVVFGISETSTVSANGKLLVCD